MKIGIVLYPTFGGSGVVATELGKALAQKGHEVHFITYAQPVRLGSYRENIFYHEVAVSNYPLFEFQPYETELASKLVDVVKHENLDLLHVHYAIPHASAAYMAQQILESHGIMIPFVTTLHGTDITLVGKDKSFEPVISFCINKSNAVTAVSESLRKDTFTHFNTNREIHVVPNFIQSSSVLPELELLERRRKYAQDGERILCHVSNFRPVKRVEDVIQIFKRVNDVIPSRLMLIGDGPDRYNAERLCRELGVCSRVITLGKIRDAANLMQLTDLFLLPSETESFGLAALEAMAEGIPVVSSNTGGIPEVNKDGYSGYLSNVGDVDGMAKNAIKILSNEATLNQFKTNAREQSKLFSLEEILPLYENIYNTILKEVQTLK
ncbi:MAG: N-acetyl-alpha-D-glucosaminyl L-malate synthase BshA [Crocinitomicaceae bacterium]|nr:N-acetyl-alpha-D-glucosaminyl L-malate synthase BshA [Crocinitomicaceae bacterium]